jgi:hypothetical protein
MPAGGNGISNGLYLRCKPISGRCQGQHRPEAFITPPERLRSIDGRRIRDALLYLGRDLHHRSFAVYTTPRAALAGDGSLPGPGGSDRREPGRECLPGDGSAPRALTPLPGQRQALKRLAAGQVGDAHVAALERMAAPPNRCLLAELLPVQGQGGMGGEVIAQGIGRLAAATW